MERKARFGALFVCVPRKGAARLIRGTLFT